MADLFLSPTKAQIEKVRELYSDPVLYWATNCAIKTLDYLSQNPNDVEPTYWRKFYAMCRLMILNYGARLPFEILELSSEDLADGTTPLWLGEPFIPPEITDEKEISSIDPATEKLRGKIKITDIAKKYGLTVRKNRSKCPFHNGSNPTSLSFDNKKNIFHCFACDVRGDLLTLIQMLEDLKDEKEKNESVRGF